MESTLKRGRDIIMKVFQELIHAELMHHVENNAESYQRLRDAKKTMNKVNRLFSDD
jgi:hypothetical protein